MSPHLLVQHSIPVVRVVQYPGEFIINYPGAPQRAPLPAHRTCSTRGRFSQAWEGRQQAVGSQLRVDLVLTHTAWFVFLIFPCQTSSQMVCDHPGQLTVGVRHIKSGFRV